MKKVHLALFLTASMGFCAATNVSAAVGILGQGNCAYASIADALNNAKDGDVVLVEGATRYFENALLIAGKDTTGNTIPLQLTIEGVANGNNCTRNQPVTPPVIDGNNNRIFQVLNDSALTLRNIRLEDGGGTFGGLIYVGSGASGTARLELEAATLINANVVGNGGLVYVGENDEVRAKKSRLSNGVAAFLGGLVYSEAGAVLSFEDTVLESGRSNHGGGVYAVESITKISETSEVSDNFADENGGGIYIDGGSLVLRDTAKLENNGETFFGRESLLGGGVYMTGGASFDVIEESKILSNKADSGAGVYVHDGSLNLQAQINYNEATQDGGGVYVDAKGLLNIENAKLINNQASNDGGGLFVDSPGNHVLINTWLDSNTASHGTGGGMKIIRGSVTMTTDPDSCSISNLPFNEYCSMVRGNIAPTSAGVEISNFPDPCVGRCEFHVDRVAFVGNDATAIFGVSALGTGEDAVLEMTNSLVAANLGSVAIGIFGATLFFEQNTIVDNQFDAAIVGGLIGFFRDNIIWGNGGNGVEFSFASVTSVDCNNYQSLINTHSTINSLSGNTSVPPQFDNAHPRGDYRLNNNSPLVDAGCISTDDMDLDHFVRIQHDVNDLGAFEFH